MIYLTRLNGKDFVLNADLIEIVEGTPDTIITLTNEKKYIVQESLDEVISRVIDFRKKIYQPVGWEEKSHEKI